MAALLPEELVLQISKKTQGIDISKYEDFIYELCGDWEFQQEAIRKTFKYYFSEEYSDTKDLFTKNYEKNPKLKTFQKLDYFLEQLPYPSKKSCTIDLATGTGKTWVMYGIARIMLAEGLVDQVLVLCPSKTVKYELFKKFSAFTENTTLTNALPKESFISVPGVKHSDETIEKGDICVDNVHKTYDHVSSSISDSLIGKGQRTLVINDEAHHILNPKGAGSSQTMLEWDAFLKDERYGFKYILNLSGTPYKGDNYFLDVIYRYSVRQAIEKRFIKDILYLKKDDSENWRQKWKAIYDNHEQLKQEYKKSKKHITIVVTNSIENCDKLATEVKQFLHKEVNLPEEVVEKQVLPVTSSPRHLENREILKTVDQPNNPVEWIISVSMLTEGWDVSNIFQIVPHEQRAFNSKLLISQVLGRGLRVPQEYRGSDILPRVWVYNHTAWSSRIDNLVREVAEISNVITSHVIKDSKFNFDLYKINIAKIIETEMVRKPESSEITLPKSLGFKSTPTDREQVFTDIQTRREIRRITDVSNQIRMYRVEEAVNAIYTNLFLIDMAKGTSVSARVSKEYIRNLILKELEAIGEKLVSEDNLQSGKASFNVLVRQFVGISKISELYQGIETMNTSEMSQSNMSESAFKTHGGLITSKENYKDLDKEDIKLLNEISVDLKDTEEPDIFDEEYYHSTAKIIKDVDQEDYKSPLNITLLSHTPEREFVKTMVKMYSNHIDAWVKSKDKGFYSIPYIHRPGTHSLQKDFNPDFFIKKGNNVIVVEIKCESLGESHVKNKDKLEGAISYFGKLNEKLEGKYIYEFHFLDPRDYLTFFEKRIVKNVKFKSQLHADLESKTREELKGQV